MQSISLKSAKNYSTIMFTGVLKTPPQLFQACTTHRVIGARGKLDVVVTATPGQKLHLRVHLSLVGFKAERQVAVGLRQPLTREEDIMGGSPTT